MLDVFSLLHVIEAGMQLSKILNDVEHDDVLKSSSRFKIKISPTSAHFQVKKISNESI